MMTARGGDENVRKQVGTFSVFEDTVEKDSARERAELIAELERCHSLLQLVAAEDEKQVSSPTPSDSLWFTKPCACHFQTSHSLNSVQLADLKNLVDERDSAIAARKALERYLFHFTLSIRLPTFHILKAIKHLCRHEAEKQRSIEESSTAVGNLGKVDPL